MITVPAELLGPSLFMTFADPFEESEPELQLQQAKPTAAKVSEPRKPTQASKQRARTQPTKASQKHTKANSSAPPKPTIPPAKIRSSKPQAPALDESNKKPKKRKPKENRGEISMHIHRSDDEVYSESESDGLPDKKRPKPIHYSAIKNGLGSQLSSASRNKLAGRPVDQAMLRAAERIQMPAKMMREHAVVIPEIASDDDPLLNIVASKKRAAHTIQPLESANTEIAPTFSIKYGKIFDIDAVTGEVKMGRKMLPGQALSAFLQRALAKEKGAKLDSQEPGAESEGGGISQKEARLSNDQSKEAGMPKSQMTVLESPSKPTTLKAQIERPMEEADTAGTLNTRTQELKGKLREERTPKTPTMEVARRSKNGGEATMRRREQTVDKFLSTPPAQAENAYMDSKGKSMVVGVSRKREPMAKSDFERELEGLNDDLH